MDIFLFECQTVEKGNAILAVYTSPSTKLAESSIRSRQRMTFKRSIVFGAAIRVTACSRSAVNHVTAKTLGSFK
jgi:hypothetical protein